MAKEQAKRVIINAPVRKKLSAVNQEDLLLFTRQLHTLLNSGINLLYALETLANQVDKESMHKVIQAVYGRIKSGFSLSKALMEHPTVFNQIYVGLVRTGEAYGDLPQALDNLEYFIEREVNIKKKIGQASTYPVFALMVCIFFAFFTFKFILPHFVAFFQDLNVELPLPTRLMIFVTKTLDKPVVLILMGITTIALIIFLKRFASTENGRRYFDRLKTEIPYFGPIVKKIAVARLANSMSALLEGGIEIRKALELAGKASGNYVFEYSMKQASENLREGLSLTKFFATQVSLFGGIFPSMVRVGEESGELPSIFKKISSMFETDVENTLNSISVIIEPMLIMFTGTIIGFIIIAVFLPLYSLLQKLG
jgi:type IV pilus assembly protein PilC